MNDFDALTCEAFVLALPQLSEPLPDALQQAIRQALSQVAKQDPTVAEEIRELTKRYPDDLGTPYKAAYSTLQQHYQLRERAKGIGSPALNAAPRSTLPNLADLATDLLTANNLVATARSLVLPLNSATHRPAKESAFWEKGDRLIALTAGGAALGAALGQLPGAMIGGILAATFAWFSNHNQPKAPRNSQ